MLELNAANEMLSLPVWAAGAFLAVLVAVCVMALRRSANGGSLAAVFGIPALVIIAWSAWTFADHAVLRGRVAERQALDARALQLTASATAPGSALACLDAGAGQAVETSCEKAVFASPEAVAAAGAYVEARLRLLADGLDYARRTDRGYHTALAGLRRAIEADRFGFVAHVLATRDGCTAEQCDAFALLRDTGIVKANLQVRNYDKTVARYAAGWAEQADATPVVTGSTHKPADAIALPAAAVVTKPIDFPSAASIPAVSIMNAEPGTSAAATAEATPAPRRAPAASATAPRTP